MPDFLIIGTQKGGTTSLYQYLVQHPQILPAKEKEIHFFDLAFHFGVDWYETFFPQNNFPARTISGEATPYYLFHPLVPERVFQCYPRIKLIVLLRNPVERAISQYYHEVRLGFEQLSLPDAIAQESQRLQGEVEQMTTCRYYASYNHQHYSYLSRGLYLEQIQRWLQYFPRSQLCILQSETFFQNPQATLDRVFSFLQLPTCKISTGSRYNRGEYPKNLRQLFARWQVRQPLARYFTQPNQQLEAFLQKKFSWG
jgi:hypothetical protein